MNNFEQEAIDAALYWNEEGFNKRNPDICIQFMHFPHIRLWNNKFSIFHSKEDFIEGFNNQTEKLITDGWNHTVTKNIEAVQSDEFKVHLLLHQSRNNISGEEYHNFHTLWILTKIAGKWGIQFRSSFVDGASQISNMTI